MPDWLVLRFGSLGDLCLLGWSLSALADGTDDTRPRVTIATKAAFAPLVSRFHGVASVEPLRGSDLGPLRDLAGRLRRGHWHRVVDAHNVLRSHALLALVGRRADARLAKDTAARLRLLSGGPDSAPLARTMVDRFDQCLLQDGAVTGGRRPPLAATSGARIANGAAPLGMAPGARWATKRWPEHHWVALIEGLAADGERDLRLFLGPDERAWFAGSRLQGAAVAAGAVVIEGLGLPDVADAVGACRRLVTNDSGLLHLAEATGTPVLAFFGPTVRQFGYFPRLEASLVLEHEIDCRPCSRNGKRPCHRGDLACLESVLPATALAALRAERKQP
ncbi:MAG: glycosyltransferase family 9 protein [bacterium]|nr:glycosyltransferase family 9 protein [bacterium]